MVRLLSSAHLALSHLSMPVTTLSWASRKSYLFFFLFFLFVWFGCLANKAEKAFTDLLLISRARTLPIPSRPSVLLLFYCLLSVTSSLPPRSTLPLTPSSSRASTSLLIWVERALLPRSLRLFSRGSKLNCTKKHLNLKKINSMHKYCLASLQKNDNAWKNSLNNYFWNPSNLTFLELT